MGNLFSKDIDKVIIKRIEEEDKQLKEFERNKPQIKEPEESHIEFVFKEIP